MVLMALFREKEKGGPKPSPSACQGGCRFLERELKTDRAAHIARAVGQIVVKNGESNSSIEDERVGDVPRRDRTDREDITVIVRPCLRNLDTKGQSIDETRVGYRSR